MLAEYSLSEADKRLFIREVFESPLWRDADRGCGWKDTVLLPVLDNLPERLHKVFYSLCCRHDILANCCPRTEGIEELVKELKKSGYKIYLLSNVGLDFHIIQNKLPVFDLFDGLFPSCDYGMLKPEKKIYETFFRVFSLVPSECIFIDDTDENVEGSIKAGMPAIKFNALNETVRDLRLKLKNAGVVVSV